MKTSIYVASAGARSGKSLVVLGLMEAFMQHFDRIGFFRPVVRDDPSSDPLIQLITERYQLGLPQDATFGCNYSTARELIQHGKSDDLLKLVLARYKGLEDQCDAILCAGTDYDRIPTALEFELNADIANNLGSVILPVLGGQGRSSEQITDGVSSLIESLEERGCDVLAVAVNRIDQTQVQNLRGMLDAQIPQGYPVLCIPDTPMLGMPTVGEIATSLNAQWLLGEGMYEDQEVANYKVAAMELPHFLNHLEEASLVITPGDRSDIILGTIAADRAKTYPHVAGLLLTGGIQPAWQVRNLMEGLERTPVPVLSVTADTYLTAKQVTDIEGALAPRHARKIAAALGTFENNVSATELVERLSTKRSQRVTPLMFEYELVQRAKSSRKHIVLPEGNDERILKAAEILRLRDVVDITLLGDEDELSGLIGNLGLRLGDVAIVDPIRSSLRETYAQTYYDLRKHKGISPEMAFDAVADVSYFGTMMVHHGDAHGMVSGAVHTTQHTIRPAFEIIRTQPDTTIVSSVFFMCLTDRVLVYGDCAVNPDPNAEQLADIAISSATTAEAFGIEPRVALLSYSTGDSGKGADVDKVRDATRIAKGRRPDLKIEGPIQYDAAVDASVAQTKMPGSEVAGRATVFIFPDLNTGNNTYKAVQRSAGAVAVGPVLQGLNKPVNDLSRGCTVTDIVNTVAITAIQAQS